MDTKVRRGKLTALEKSWILYDVGNSAFVLLVATLLPIFFETIALADGINKEMYLSYWGYAGSIATAFVAIIGPVCGTMADHKGYKKPIFAFCLIVGIFGTIALGAAGSWLFFLAVYILAKVGYSSSLVFYDSMLTEVTDEKNMDKISSMGYAYGYIGSVIPFIVCLVFYLFSGSLGLTETQAMIICFLITAGWWLWCSIPLLRNYKQTAYLQQQGKPLQSSARELGNTLKHAVKHKKIGLYLLACFFFINGVYTIIDMATAYGTALGLEAQDLLLALLLTQFVAFPFAILFGRLSAQVAAGKLIKICIICYTCITLFAMFLVTEWQFWLLAVLVGMFQGGIQALSRSYLGKIIPAEHSGSYYGLMDICGKGASLLGMLVVSFVNQITIGIQIPPIFGLQLQNENLAVGALLILFIIGFVLFCKADKMNQD